MFFHIPALLKKPLAPPQKVFGNRIDQSLWWSLGFAFWTIHIRLVTINKWSNPRTNCKQLNGASAYFDGGLVEMKTAGTHYIASTRNNDA